MSTTVHWLGAGLSSGPGIRALAKSEIPLVVWNRTLSKAQEALGDAQSAQVSCREFSIAGFSKDLKEGDIVVSMLPATMHIDIAEICIFAHAHLVTTSYISDVMRTFDREARELKLCFINESGLDPGIDHIFARELMFQVTETVQDFTGVDFSFRSLCGGFPKTPTPFCYKFSWSPLGVLRALKNQAKYVTQGQLRQTDCAWKELFSFSVGNEVFEAYPNRDSLQYLEEYGFDGDFSIREFVRGTLRPSGWMKTWTEQGIFQSIEYGSLQELEALSQKLWKEHQYTEKEKDRVVLSVELELKRDGQTIWKNRLGLDECGTESETAMARTVSLPATFAVESILQGTAPYGVSGAPRDRQEALRWIKKLDTHGIHVVKTQ